MPMQSGFFYFGENLMMQKVLKKMLLAMGKFLQFGYQKVMFVSYPWQKNQSVGTFARVEKILQIPFSDKKLYRYLV